jgi:hypothetical protein
LPAEDGRHVRIAEPPAPNQDCPDVGGFFGNTDIFGGFYADPTTP